MMLAMVMVMVMIFATLLILITFLALLSCPACSSRTAVAAVWSRAPLSLPWLPKMGFDFGAYL